MWRVQRRSEGAHPSGGGREEEEAGSLRAGLFEGRAVVGVGGRLRAGPTVVEAASGVGERSRTGSQRTRLRGQARRARFHLKGVDRTAKGLTALQKGKAIRL